MKKLILISALLSVQYAYSQTPPIEREKWVEKPVIYALNSKYSKEPAIVVSDKIRVEFVDETKQEMAEYYTMHKIIHINDDRGIETFNKIYLNFNEKSDIVDVKARTILPGGKIIELDKNNIKDIKDKEGNEYKIFALDGLEKGCDVEYLYTFKRPVSFFGREVVQGNSPILETTFQIIAPGRLKFDLKPYNFEIKASDTVLNDKRLIQCNFKETTGIEDEKYAYNVANLNRIEYKLSYNESTGKGVRLFMWNELAKRIYGVYTAYTDREAKQVADLVKQNGWDKLPDETAKIIAVENYIKSKFSYDEEQKSDDGNRIETILKNKASGIIGLMRLYGAIFQNLSINNQFVLTGDREKFIIDRDFENWNNCDFPIFYFPAENKFIAPTKPDYRYPWIFPSWGATNGVFFKHTSLGSFSTAIAEVKPIPLEDYSHSLNNIESRLEFSSGLDSLKIDNKQIFSGYVAVTYRDAFNFANDEQKREIIKELAKAYSSSENIIFSEVLNKEFENENTNKPLILHVTTKSGELIERAGNKLLLKVGAAIGPQVEMYQEKPRQQPINIDYGHVEERKIDVVIPEGYKINNLNDLKMDQTFKDNGELTMGFVSDYELKGNILSIHIMEEYRNTFYPHSQFDQFRKIINASSDFNKVVLVMEKK